MNTRLPSLYTHCLQILSENPNSSTLAPLFVYSPSTNVHAAASTPSSPVAIHSINVCVVYDIPLKLAGQGKRDGVKFVVCQCLPPSYLAEPFVVLYPIRFGAQQILQLCSNDI
ncbi:hypothetical protein L2E82_44629 [Cichorium intybus]|uniref:Uncharacterized protein n=1 Tax=Cichorium intybus TaxID=13427 RepID=A0ACB8ZRR8_CICIN|nr:hypothetical protein L2E82_44629 [Cichorium intybus]